MKTIGVKNYNSIKIL